MGFNFQTFDGSRESCLNTSSKAACSNLFRVTKRMFETWLIAILAFSHYTVVHLPSLENNICNIKNRHSVSMEHRNVISH